MIANDYNDPRSAPRFASPTVLGQPPPARCRECDRLRAEVERLTRQLAAAVADGDRRARQARGYPEGLEKGRGT